MIDSHAHLSFESFNDDRDEVIRRMQDAGVNGWIEVGTTLNDSKSAVDLANQYPQAFATVGVHPSDITGLTDHDFLELEQLAGDKKVVAIGEVGLDFYRGGSSEEQSAVLKRFISIANQHKLPVVFHVRDGQALNAHDELIKILGVYSDTDRPTGVIHTFSGSQKQASQYLELGMYLSFSGVITFKNAGEIVEVAKAAPLDKILIETDCPFLTPDHHRGQRNEPAYVALVAKKIAEIRGIDEEQVGSQTQINTETLFNCKF